MVLPFTLQQLRIFKAIASEKSFTQAAEILFVSQPSLSKQIKTLENRLGILLLNRNGNKISLTEAGNVFLQYSERILALCEESCRALNDLKDGERGNLKVGASQTIGAYLMPRVLTLFAQSYPQITLNIDIDSTRIIAKKVADRIIDIAIVGGDIPNGLKKNLEIEDFVEDELILIIPKSHPFARKKKKKIIKYINLINQLIIEYVEFVKKIKNIQTGKVHKDVDVAASDIGVSVSFLRAVCTGEYKTAKGHSYCYLNNGSKTLSMDHLISYLIEHKFSSCL